MRGTFRRDVEIRVDPASPGSFSLARRASSRNLSRGLIALSFAAALFDLWLRRPGVAVAQLALFTGFLLAHLFGEAWAWRFSGEEVVTRRLALGGVRVQEEKLKAREIRRVAIQASGTRARAWLELESGETYALVEGRAAEVEALVGRVQRMLLLARVEQKGQTLH